MRFIIKDNNRISDAIQFISGLPTAKPWIVDIKEYKPNRSNSQNNLYWSWLEVIGNYMGETKDDLHERFATRFLGVTEKEVKFRNEHGDIQTEILRRPVSTATLKTKEFTDYLNNIEMTIAVAFPELRLPYPDDYKYAMGGPKP